jgi:hypothetical protein
MADRTPIQKLLDLQADAEYVRIKSDPVQHFIDWFKTAAAYLKMEKYREAHECDDKVFPLSDRLPVVDPDFPDEKYALFLPKIPVSGSPWEIGRGSIPDPASDFNLSCQST